MMRPPMSEPLRPGASDQTIRLEFDQLRAESKIRVDGTGHAATWTGMGSTAHSE